MTKGKDGAGKTDQTQGGRLLAHVDMDAFYASVEILDNPSLAGKPVVVGGDSSRSVVSAASYAARAFGVRSAMPMVRARQLCPHLIILPVRMSRYKEVSRQVMEILEGFTPVVEQVSVDEAYLDLSGTSRIWGGAAQAGRAIKGRVKEETGLNCSVGLAPMRYLAKIASDRDKPDGLTVVADVEAFLGTVTLAEVPGIGKKAQQRLGAMGLKRLVDLRALDEKQMERLFGVWGLRMLRLAWGKDDTPIGRGAPVKSVSHEITLSGDTSDRQKLEALLLELGHKVAARLRAKGLAGRVITLKLKTADHTISTRRTSLEQATDDGSLIVATAKQLLAAHKSPGPFRLVGVGAGGLMDAQSGQGDLFGRKELGRTKALGRAEDEVRRRFGSGSLLRAGQLSVMDQTTNKLHNGGESD